MSLPERIRSDLPVARVTGEVLPPEEWGEPPPHVGHPAPPTRRGWVIGGIMAAVIVAVPLALSSLPNIVGWFR